MPSISGDASRHVVIDARPAHYLSFPDVRLARDGTLVCVYRQADQHVATRQDLLIASSADQGRTWSPPRYLNPGLGHCARMTPLPDGRLVIIDDQTQSQFWSLDNGRTFHRAPCSGSYVTIPDRVLALRPDLFLTTGHDHQGERPQPKIRQAPSEQMVYASNNQGGHWRPWSVLAFDPGLVLCEASMTRLEDGSILALMRENSFVFEPMYFSVSRDEGSTWSHPRPTPLCGHRPTVALTPSGKLLATYRAVGPDGGTAAWMGSLEDLDHDFQVHGLHPAPDNPSLTPEGLLIDGPEGLDHTVRYALRPMTDPERARAQFSCEVKAIEVDEKTCGIHFGDWWRIHPDRIETPGKDAEPIPVTPGEFIRLTLRYSPGSVEAEVNGAHVGTYPMDALQADTRAVLFGSSAAREKNGGKHIWRSASLAIQEPRYERDFLWSWDHTMGFPDAYVQARVLELDNDRKANSGDYGYSGWDALPDGRYFCAYHHGGSDQPDYQPSRSSHIRGAWFSDSDFTTNP